MIENSRMHFLLPHFMNNGIDGRCRKLIHKYGIIVMNIGVDSFIDFITQKKRLVAEVDFNEHVMKIQSLGNR